VNNIKYIFETCFYFLATGVSTIPADVFEQNDSILKTEILLECSLQSKLLNKSYFTLIIQNREFLHIKLGIANFCIPAIILIMATKSMQRSRKLCYIFSFCAKK